MSRPPLELTRSASRLVAILDEVLAGHRPQVAHLDAILEAHGWPDIEEVRKQAEHLRRLGRLDVTFDIFPRRP